MKKPRQLRPAGFVWFWLSSCLASSASACHAEGEQADGGGEKEGGGFGDGYSNEAQRHFVNSIA